MFEPFYSNQASKFFRKADKILAKRLLDKIDELNIDPIHHDAKSVEGYKEKLFRVRVGDYRILYEVEYNPNKIGIVKIDKRSKVFD